MADIADVINIIDHTPVTQAILLKGIHGVGKSESIKHEMELRGYQMKTLFLGQAADPGDIIGLPTKRTRIIPEQKIKMTVAGKEVIETIAEHEEEYTDFAPPKWWPFDMEGKYVIFLDEINRGKPEVMQCIMDMVLNRKLNGRFLPPNTRIIAAMNPLDDGYYQVEELDPALLDRFNIYDFKPTHQEWLQWAMNFGVHEIVTGFISKHTQFLDPPSSKEAKVGGIYPSRRSWKRVSDILTDSPGLIDSNMHTLKTILGGVVGLEATAALGQYISTLGSGLSGKAIVKDWSTSIQAKVKKLKIQEQMHINLQIVSYVKESSKELKADKKLSELYSKNIEKYLDTVDVEAQADFFGYVTTATNEKLEWPRLIINANPSLGSKFMNVIRGKKNEE